MNKSKVSQCKRTIAALEKALSLTMKLQGDDAVGVCVKRAEDAIAQAWRDMQRARVYAMQDEASDGN